MIFPFLSPPLKAGGDYVIGRITFPSVRLCVCVCVSNLGFQGFKVLKSQVWKSQVGYTQTHANVKKTQVEKKKKFTGTSTYTRTSPCPTPTELEYYFLYKIQMISLIFKSISQGILTSLFRFVWKGNTASLCLREMSGPPPFKMTVTFYWMKLLAYNLGW